KAHGYRWKMIALIDLNEFGEFVLPNSQIVVEVGLLPWPREAGGVPPAGYEHCGCIGYESDDDDDTSSKIDENDDDDDDACVPLSMPSTFTSNSCESDDWEI
ncbi:unnamed protein product, partial [Rotaria magnacalcarata]